MFVVYQKLDFKLMFFFNFTNTTRYRTETVGLIKTTKLPKLNVNTVNIVELKKYTVWC